MQLYASIYMCNTTHICSITSLLLPVGEETMYERITELNRAGCANGFDEETYLRRLCHSA